MLGGGLVPGSFVLLGGEPGIGKSTLTLQLAASASSALIASGEESSEQISLRAQRLGIDAKTVSLLAETDIGSVIATAAASKPSLLIVDSVQVMSAGGSPGTPREVRLVAESLLHFAKASGTPVLLVGHVTKEGDLAGPRVLEHLVDVVLQLAGERSGDLRLLSAAKNRFGATNEVGVFAMEAAGLTEVANPSQRLLAGRSALPGSVICPVIVGSRPVLVEAQALVCAATTAYPRRVASGVSLQRLLMIVAVLERHAGLRLDRSDVIVSIVGGLSITEPALDAALAVAIASSNAATALPDTAAVFGEVGLTGELRSVQRANDRQRESTRAGYCRLVQPSPGMQLTTLLQDFLNDRKPRPTTRQT